ncbi:putative glycine-rich cell wall structural protein 1 [Amaranthus tricolor]|uniref:putative glycine-rich cell wall structural protein 1 n=1 Tax=Amaranthus tricolor TaxID=29722 RepID=UPI0025905EBD|nr:putative glycine-rich cell wall structural protein 1 [Amaranthus tricolor]
MNIKASVFLILLIISTIFSLTQATRSSPKPKNTKPKGDGGGFGGSGPGDDFFGPGGGYGIPGFDDPGIFGGGYGYGYGSPSGGHSKSGTIRPSIVCKEKGPCYNKKLICPAKCFYSFSRAGKGYGGGGGGGGCTMDCKKKCVAYC